MLPRLTYAANPPALLSPQNISTTTQSTLSWQLPNYSLYPTNPFRIQIDDDQNFVSLEKDYYTKNTTYSPTLSIGTWYWKVKAKNSEGVWSDWSTPWSFTLTDETPPPSSSPSPSPSSTTSPTPSPSASPPPSPSPTPTPTPTPSGSPSPQPIITFEVTSLPSKVTSSESFTIKVSLKNLTVNSKYYLKGAFLIDGGSNYFGKTKVGGEWVKNNQTFSSQLPITTDPLGYWNGEITLMPDSEDSGFTGSGPYIFKVARYNSSGSGPTWSNPINIEVTKEEVTETSNETVLDNSEKDDEEGDENTTESKFTKAKHKIPLSLTENKSSVAGESTSSSLQENGNTKVQGQKIWFNFWIAAGTSTLIAGISALVYFWKKH